MRNIYCNNATTFYCHIQRRRPDVQKINIKMLSHCAEYCPNLQNIVPTEYWVTKFCRGNRILGPNILLARQYSASQYSVVTTEFCVPIVCWNDKILFPNNRILGHRILSPHIAVSPHIVLPYHIGVSLHIVRSLHIVP